MATVATALGQVAKRQQTEDLYEELGAAADALIEVQEAVDAGLDCIEKLAEDVEARLGIDAGS